MKTGDKIYHYRKKLGLSQEAFAEKIGISRQAVSKWETGEAMPESDKLLSLSRLLGVTVDHLLSDEDPPFAAVSDDAPDPSQNTIPNEKNVNCEKQTKFAPGTAFVRLIKKYGYLLGVYIALIGLGFSLIGTLAMFISFGVSSIFSTTTNKIIHLGNQVIGDLEVESVELPSYNIDELFPSDSSGNISVETSYDVQYNEKEYVSGFLDVFDSIDKMTVFNPVMILGAVMLGIGIVLILVGVILAIILKIKYSNKEHI